MSRFVLACLLVLALASPAASGAAMRAKLPNGKLLVLTVDESISDDAHAIVSRYKPNRRKRARRTGSQRRKAGKRWMLDPSFGDRGRVEVRTPQSQGFRPVGLLVIGTRVVIGGRHDNPRFLRGSAFALAALDARGRIDTNFGDGQSSRPGFAIVDLDGDRGGSVVAGAVYLSGETLVLAGSFFSDDGSDGILGRFAFARFTLGGSVIDYGVGPPLS